MYKRVLHSSLAFNDLEIFDDDTKNLLRGLLQRNPLLRMTDDRIKRHPYFSSISWDHVHNLRYVAPFIPEVDPLDETDTRNFDEAFLGMRATVAGYEGDEDEEIEVEEGDRSLPDGKPEEAFDEHGNDVFDGYSFFGKATDDEEEDIMDDEEVLDSDEEGEEDSSSGRMNSESTLAHATPEEYQVPHLLYHHNSDLPLSPLTMLLGNRSRIIEHLASQEEDDDDDWHVVHAEGEAKNGSRAATLFAMGVRDRYRLLVTNSSSTLLSPSSSTRPNNYLSPSSSVHHPVSTWSDSNRSSDASMVVKRKPLARLLSRNSSTEKKSNKLNKSSTSTTSSKARAEYASRGLEMSQISVSTHEEEGEKLGALKRTLSAFTSRSSKS